MSTLWITSFNEKMYHATGKRLVESFLKYQPDDHQMMVCYENMEFKSDSSRIIPYPLHQSEFLNTWLQENQDVIPVYLGGICKTKLSKWNRKASCWFRKIAALHDAFQQMKDQFKYLMWVDCDCYFLDSLITKQLEIIFGSSHVIYHLGPHRSKNNKGWESGILGFHGIGTAFLDKVCEVYTNKTYRKYSRWDDGYVFKLVSRKFTHQSKITDLVATNQKSIDVIPYGPFAPYLKHEKGTHARLGINEVN